MQLDDAMFEPAVDRLDQPDLLPARPVAVMRESNGLLGRPFGQKLPVGDNGHARLHQNHRSRLDDQRRILRNGDRLLKHPSPGQRDDLRQISLHVIGRRHVDDLCGPGVHLVGVRVQGPRRYRVEAGDKRHLRLPRAVVGVEVGREVLDRHRHGVGRISRATQRYRVGVHNPHVAVSQHIRPRLQRGGQREVAARQRDVMSLDSQDVIALQQKLIGGSEVDGLRRSGLMRRHGRGVSGGPFGHVPPRDFDAVEIGDEPVVVVNHQLQRSFRKRSGSRKSLSDIDRNILVPHVVENGGVVFVAIAKPARPGLPGRIVEFNLRPGLARLARRLHAAKEPPGRPRRHKLRPPGTQLNRHRTHTGRSQHE